MDLFAKRHARMAVQRPRLRFMMGVLLTGLGLVFLVAATLRAGVLPRWCGFELLAWVVFRNFGRRTEFRGGRPYLVGARTRARVGKKRGS
jgi:hypothetical protein